MRNCNTIEASMFSPEERAGRRSTHYSMAKSRAAKRPRLVAISQDMRRMCALLSDELLHWPGVRVRPMFGMRAIYRDAVVFAMLPDKRALESPTAIAYKLPAGGQRRETQKWQLLELENERGVVNALACLDKAYRRAGSTRK